MGVCDCNSANNHPVMNNPTLKNSKGASYIKCTYEIKDFNMIQLLNYKGKKYINEEIETKIKILNGAKAEPLVFQKKFTKLGMNTIIFIIEENLVNMSYLFNECKSLKKIEFISFETIQCTNMCAMFQCCEELEYLDLSNFNTSNVTDMSFMFNICYKLRNIKGLDKFNTNKVTKMNQMFQLCKELEYINLSNFNTSNVTNMEYMFRECNKLKEIKGLNNFRTIYVNNMEGMFYECKELKNLDLTYFNTSHVTNMSFMFNECEKLKEIKGINNFNTIY